MSIQEQIDLQQAGTEPDIADFLCAENARLGETPGVPSPDDHFEDMRDNWSPVKSTFPATNGKAEHALLVEPEPSPVAPWSIITAAALGACVGVLLGIQF